MAPMVVADSSKLQGKLQRSGVVGRRCPPRLLQNHCEGFITCSRLRCAEFHKMFEALAAPKAAADGSKPQAFHVIAPSLPGYGFSSAPRQPGFGVQKIAQTFDALMCALGYQAYVAQGAQRGGPDRIYLPICKPGSGVCMGSPAQDCPPTLKGSVFMVCNVCMQMVLCMTCKYSPWSCALCGLCLL